MSLSCVAVCVCRGVAGVLSVLFSVIIKLLNIILRPFPLSLRARRNPYLRPPLHVGKTSTDPRLWANWKSYNSHDLRVEYFNPLDRSGNLSQKKQILLLQ